MQMRRQRRWETEAGKCMLKAEGVGEDPKSKVESSPSPLLGSQHTEPHSSYAQSERPPGSREPAPHKAPPANKQQHPVRRPTQ